MFWRKKNDGFEWHKYVRTTIKLRREDRRRRVEAAKGAAMESLDGAGRAGIAAGKSGVMAAAAAMLAAVRAVSKGLAAATRWTVQSARQGGGAASRTAGNGVRVAARAVTALASWAWQDSRRRMPLLARVPDRAAAATAIGVAMVALVTLAVVAARSLPSTGLNPLALLPGLGPAIIEGRAVAVDGGTLRVDARLVRLAGIEAPEIDQRCGRKAVTRCGAAAHKGLRDLVRTRKVRCETSGTGDGGHPLAVCTDGNGRDLAAELTAKGLVFAQEGLFQRYATQQQQARDARRGIWRTDSPERPGTWRDRRWEEARRSAPEGCPIKGHVVGKDRRYVLPWSPQYERVKVREARGGRWFCSETEARAAGWRSIERS